jgi:hypothetical protein
MHEHFAEIVEALERMQPVPERARETLTAIRADSRVRRDQLPGAIARSVHEMDDGGAKHAPFDYGQAVPRVRRLIAA